MGKTLLFLTLLLSNVSFAQFKDDFSDGNFTMNPTWSGSSNVFSVNTNGQLQSTLTNVAQTTYLSTANSYAFNVKWEFSMQMNFDPSATNLARIYLVSNQQDLTGSLNGYYLQVGEVGTADTYDLYRQTGTTSVKIIDGPTKVRANANLLSAKVRITRDSQGKWELYTDITGGTNYTLEGSVTDNTHTSTNSFGVFCRYTATRSNGFIFDDFDVDELVPDVTPPRLVSAKAISSTVVEAVFSEALNSTSTLLTNNYFLTNNYGNPSSVTAVSQNTYRLTYPNALTTNNYTLTVSGLADLKGNSISSSNTANFFHIKPYDAIKGDIVINEIFADPTPQIGLPNAEFLELWNTTSEYILLNGWKYSDATTTYTFGTDTIAPNSYLILCPNASVNDYRTYGKTKGLSIWPSLNNDKDNLKLQSATGVVIDAVNYLDTWYKDAVKKDGGYTLELIDPKNKCTGIQNWQASNATIGGTPGMQNSVYQSQFSNTVPKLLSMQMLDGSTFRLTFSKSIDSLSASIASIYSFNNGIGMASSASPTSPLFNTVDVKFSKSITRGIEHTLTVGNLTDCAGNAVDPNANGAKILWPNPTFTSVRVISSTVIEVVFSESLSPSSTLLTNNYALNNNYGSPSSVTAINQTTYRLTYPTSLTTNNYVLSASGLKDAQQNAITINLTANFFHVKPYDAVKGDIVINEIFADPTPQIGLPNAEFIELWNTTSEYILLNGWKYSDATTTYTFGIDTIAPNSYLILCPSTNVSDYKVYGKTKGLNSWPSLNNSSDNLKLQSATGVFIDEVNYFDTWYKDAVKKDGGYSLELIDPKNRCVGIQNWQASNATIGGTPGTQNSVFQSQYSNTAPKLLSMVMLDGFTFRLTFSKSIDSLSASVASIYSFNNGIGMASSASPTSSLFNTVDVKFPKSITRGIEYTLTIGNLTDCVGNAIDPKSNSTKILWQPFTLVSARAVSSTVVEAIFSEPINTVSALLTNNYSLNNGYGSPSSVTAVSQTIYRLTYPKSLTTNNYNLVVSGVTDVYGNVISSSNTANFFHIKPYNAVKGDIVINEIFADQTPQIGLPNAEFIELWNTTPEYILLNGWKYSDASSTYTFGIDTIAPSSYFILCPSANVNDYKVYGKTRGLNSWPSLNNSSDNLKLQSVTGVLIDEVNYLDTWYKDAVKKDGGYSLELIDPKNRCVGIQNWQASNATIGGTPGIRNSVYQNQYSNIAPKLLSMTMLDGSTFRLTFNKSVDSLSASVASIYSFNNGIGVASSASPISPSFNIVDIKFPAPITRGLEHTLTIGNLTDCAGNLIDPNSNTAKIFWAKEIKPNSLLITEVLFDPKGTNPDYVEVYNNTEDILDLKDLRLANADAAGNQANIRTVTTNTTFIQPKMYWVLTTNPIAVQNQYYAKYPNQFVGMTSLPSYNNDKGTVILATATEVIDRLDYDAKMHHPLLKDPDGVALERISLKRPTNELSNFTSASQLVGFGTPTYASSQSEDELKNVETFKLLSKTFSPDGDGFEDLLSIEYNLQQSGKMATVNIFSDKGRLIRRLQTNANMPTTGILTWDGLDENGRVSGVGIYILKFEVFDLLGKKDSFTKTCVLASKF